MCDSDLSQTLESAGGSNGAECESCWFDVTGVKDELIQLDVGLDLVYARNPTTMEDVATVLMAVNKMKKSPLRSYWEPNDEHYSVTMDNLVDDSMVSTAANNSTQAKKMSFLRANSLECTLRDNSQKDIVCTSGDLKLQAVTLRGGYGDRKVSFKMVKYISTGQNSQTCVLSIKNLNLYISCTMDGDNAKLNLEKCSEGSLRNISDEGNTDRFLFKLMVTGKNITTFESVRCSGWFISTSSEDEKQPVAMCKVDANHRIIYFKISS